MGLSANTVWEVQSTASDNNGGGFVTGASGADFSQQTSAQATLSTSSVVNSTTTIIDVDSGDYTCTDDDVGNILQITGGTATAGFYQITGRSGQQWTLDRSAGTAGQTVVGAMGGALATIQTALTQMTVAGMRCYIKATGTYSISTSLTGGTASNSSTRTRVEGYTTNRGDAGRATIQASAAITMLAPSSSSRNWSWANLLLDGNSDTASKGIAFGTANLEHNYINIKVQDCSGEGIDLADAARQTIDGCEVTGCGGTNGAIDLDLVTDGRVFNTWCHDNGGVGFYGGDSASIVFDHCRATNNSSHGFNVSYYESTFSHCIAFGNGGDGIRQRSNPGLWGWAKNCIFVGNGGYGINYVSSQNVEDYLENDYNAFYNNTSGARNNLNAGSNDVALTGDPFTASGSDDYTLNDTAGAGAACRAAGIPANVDIGVYQHADPAGGGGLLVHPGMSGGMRG